MFIDVFVVSGVVELVNGRLAMLGFLTGALAELSGNSLLQQLSAAPQIVLLTSVLITAGSIIPVVKVRTRCCQQFCNAVC